MPVYSKDEFQMSGPLLKVMIAFALVATLVIGTGWSLVAFAHGGSHATIKIIRTSAANWAFELQAPLAKLDHAMQIKSNGRAADMTGVQHGSNKHKELLVEYVKRTFSVSTMDDNNSTDNRAATLGRGRIRLGENASIFQFEIRELPESPAQLIVSLPYMRALSGHQNILYLVDGDREESFLLTEENNYELIDIDFFSDPVVKEHN